MTPNVTKENHRFGGGRGDILPSYTKDFIKSKFIVHIFLDQMTDRIKSSNEKIRQMILTKKDKVSISLLHTFSFGSLKNYQRTIHHKLYMYIYIHVIYIYLSLSLSFPLSLKKVF